MFPRVGFGVCRRSRLSCFATAQQQRTENRQQQTDWRSKCYFSKIFALLENFRNSYCNSSYYNRRIVEITEMSATLRWASGRGPRNVTFKSVRPPDRATGRWDKVLELLLIKNLHTSRNFQQLQLFSIKSTNRRNY